MQNETFFLTNFYNNFPRHKGLLKTESTDFIVQEIYENEVCTDKPKVNFDIIFLLDSFLDFLEKNEGLTLLEVKNNNFIFDKQNFTFHLQTKENSFLEPNFNLSETEEDEELKEKVFDYLNKLTFKEYSFTCTDKQLRKEVHDFLKPHPFIFTYSDGIFFKIKTCLIQNYSFILKKMNKDTSDIKNLLENNLQNTIEPINKELEGKGILTNEFLNNYDLLECDKNVISCKVSFSGNKDRKALTYQRMNVKCNFINLFNSSFFNLKIMDIKRSNKSLNLGELNGNKFIIKIRKINELENQSNNSIINYENSIYFLNYFGMQRFGKSKNNHLIGELIHQNKIKEALNCILFTCFNARKERDSLIDLYNEKKYDELLKLIPRSLFMERKILFLLKNNTKDILKRLPRESLMLFLHAYQSYTFNEEVNKLLAKEEVKVYLKKENEFILSDKYEIKDAYLKLPALNNKLAKGTYRKVLGLAEQVKVTENENEFVVEFVLDKGCYATMFLRELFDFRE